MPNYAIEIRNNTNIRLYKGSFVSSVFDNLFPQSVEPNRVQRVIVAISNEGNQDIMFGYQSETDKDVGFNCECRFQNGALDHYRVTGLAKNQILGIRAESIELPADDEVAGGVACIFRYI